MKVRNLLLLLLLAGLLAYGLAPQFRSFDRMGERRFQTLNRPTKEILVGVIWPFSVNQDEMSEGLQLAQEEINALGLAHGIPIRLILRDDKFDWERAKQIAVEFSNTPNMSAVLGYYDDSEAVKASTIYEPSRLLHMIVGSNATSMTSVGFRYIVRTIVSSDKIGRALAKLTIERGHHKVAMIWEEGAYGEELAYAYSIALNSLNGELVYANSYARERADFRLVVNQLKEMDIDMVFFCGLEPWAGDFIRMARSVGVKTEILGAFSDTPAMRAHAGQSLEGIMFFDYYNPRSPTPENQLFVKKFRARFEKDPDSWAAQGYDSLHILAKAVQATASANPLDLVYSIRFMDAWQGANGQYKFNRDGELDDKPIVLKVYRQGTPVIFEESVPEPAPPVLETQGW